MNSRLLISGRNAAWNAVVGWSSTPGAQWVPSLHPDDPSLPIVGGRRIQVIRKTAFELNARAGATETLPLRTRIDARAYMSAVLVVRVHSLADWGPYSSLSIELYNESLCDDDPGVEFVASSALASVSIDSSTAAPWLGIDTTGSGSLGGLVRVVAKWSQGEVESDAPQRTELSVDLLGRTHTRYPVTPLTRLRRSEPWHSAVPRPPSRAELVPHPNGAPGFGVFSEG